jgi:hypothetical protein
MDTGLVFLPCHTAFSCSLQEPDPRVLSSQYVHSKLGFRGFATEILIVSVSFMPCC